jgi:hypothetical protein
VKSDLEGILSKVNNVRCVKYNFKSDPPNAVERYGFIAQNIQSEFPDMVNDSSDHLVMSYEDMIPISIAAIKELHCEMKQLRGEVAELRETARQKF